MTSTTKKQGSERLSVAVQALHDQQSQKSKRGLKESLREKSAIMKTIETIKNDPSRNHVLTMRDYLARMQQIPRLAYLRADEDAFAVPQDMNMSTLRLTTSMLSSRFMNFDNRTLLDEPVSLMREMLLVTYEAKPRHISYGITGYTMSDFLAYIYQDVIMNGMGMSAARREQPFSKRIDDLKTWMLMPSGKSAVNSPRRHIRRRLMCLLDRTNHQVAALFEDREIPNELSQLVFKLLERDDDEGYTQGRIRPYREVRADFNALTEFCIRKRFPEDYERIANLNRIVCPSVITDFPGYPIDLPRGRASQRAEVNDLYVKPSELGVSSRNREAFLTKAAQDSIAAAKQRRKVAKKSAEEAANQQPQAPATPTVEEDALSVLQGLI